MDELLAWLRLQVDADERVLNAAADDGRLYDWIIHRDTVRVDGLPDPEAAEVVAQAGRNCTREMLTHIVRFDPQRQLDEVVAKRAMLSAYARALEHVAYVEPRTSATEYESMLLLARGRVSEWERVVRLLAVAYVSREGFREAWRTA